MPAPHPCPRRRLLLAALAMTLALGACASLQQPVAPVPIDAPAAWTVAVLASPPETLTRWWDRFGDSVLSAQVERALQASTDIEAATARLRQARAQRDLSAAGLAPTASAGASVQASRSEGRPTTEQYRIGVDASWEPDLWGGAAASVQAAEASAQASAATLAATRLAVAAEAALNVLQWHGQLARLAIAQANLDSQAQTLQIVRWRAEAGLVTQLDVEQARTAVEQTRAQIPALQTAIGQTLNALAVLTARAPGSLQGELAAAEGAAQPEAPADLALAMPAEVLRQRPDVRAAERQVAAAAARVEAADAARLPSLNLGGSIGLSALSLSALGPGAGVASLTASVNLPLLDGGRIRGQVRVQEAAQAEAAAAYRAAVLGALQDVEDTLLALRGTREQLASQRQAATAARAAATLAEQRYASGLVDFQNVLQTQRARLSADDAAAAALTTLNTLHVRLYKALGGGWNANDNPELAAR
jgi:NodT family efflux transporter outer membrane factor (OMF) lipoprotein